MFLTSPFLGLIGTCLDLFTSFDLFLFNENPVRVQPKIFLRFFFLENSVGEEE